MSKRDVSQEAVDEAIWSVSVLLEAMQGRITDLKMIWRRQRMDVDTQIRYYANGLLQDYYRKYRKEEFDTDLEDFGEESEWDSEDEWSSEDGAEDAHVADNTNTSNAAESNQPATNRSIPAGDYNSAPRGMAPPLPARAPPVRISNNQQRPYDQVQHESYADSTTYRGAGDYGDHRDVTHHYDEEEGEAVGGFHGEEDHGEGEGEDEEPQEQEPEPEDEQEEDYHGSEPVEYDGEEQGYNAHQAHNYGGYEADQMDEEGEGEGEDEYDGGYSY